MTIIAMPDGVHPSDATVLLRDFGAVLTPFLGGPEQRINRLGTRFALRVTLPPMDTKDEALVIQSRLLRSREDRLQMAWPQPGFDTGYSGAPIVAAGVTSGTTITLAGLIPGYVVREGQFFSIVHAGRRYVHMFAANRSVSSDGSVTAAIWPMLRTPLSAADFVEIAVPRIEGLVSPGEEISWQISVDRMTSFSFTISEGA